MLILRTYYNSLKGLRKEVWLLSLVTFVNRAGTMVIPFLSLYLTSDRGFTLQDVGWVMSSFGMGSFVGSWLGGKLTDRWGYYPVMFWSLLLTGFLFVLLQFVESFLGFCAGIFLVMVVADTFRPAVYVALTAYSKPENRARSIGLIRLAINLGFSFGPAAGGMIIAGLSYAGLFWVDGITCLLAVFVLVYALKSKTLGKEKEKEEVDADRPVKLNKSPYKDWPFIMFITAMMLLAISFLQLFSTIPLYYRDGYGMSEDQIGWLMAANGFFIFLFEMPLIKKFESDRYSLHKILVISTLIMAASFFVLNMSSWIGVIFIGMFLITVGEMFNFPFGNSWAMSRSEGRRQGAYMGMMTMSFAMANIIGHNLGMHLIANYGYTVTWYVMTAILLLAVVFLIWMKRFLEKEKSELVDG